jgi:hypothetical protein
MHSAATWSKVLSQSEIRTLWNQGSGICANLNVGHDEYDGNLELESWYRLGFQPSDPALDYSPNGRDLSVFSAPPIGPGSAGLLSPLSDFVEYPDVPGAPFAEGEEDSLNITLAETAATSPGVPYLVVYRAGGAVVTEPPKEQYGEIQMQLEQGSSVLGYTIGSRFAGAGGTPDLFGRGPQVRGFTWIMGDGNTLRLRGDFLTGDNDDNLANFGACSIVAVPMSLPNAGHDYFTDINNTTTEISMAANNDGSFEPDPVSSASLIASLTIDAPDTGDYLVLLSAEMQVTGSSAANTVFMHAVVDGSGLGGGPVKHQPTSRGDDWTPPRSEWLTWAHAEIVNLSKGFHVIDIRALGTQGLEVIRRPRIIVLRKNSFGDIKQEKLTVPEPDGGQSTGSSSWHQTIDMFPVLYLSTSVAAQTESVLLLANAVARGGEEEFSRVSSGALYEIRSFSDESSHSYLTGSMMARNRPWWGQAGFSLTLLTALASLNAGQSKDFALRHRMITAAWGGGIATGRGTDVRADPATVPPFGNPVGNQPGATTTFRDTRLISLHLRATGV